MRTLSHAYVFLVIYDACYFTAIFSVLFLLVLLSLVIFVLCVLRSSDDTFICIVFLLYLSSANGGIVSNKMCIFLIRSICMENIETFDTAVRNMDDHNQLNVIK